MTQAVLARPRHIVLMLGFIIAIGPVSVDMYLPAFGLIGQEFGPGTPQLTLAAYFFGFAIGQLVQGWLADRWGRRNALAAGLAIYVLGSFGCALTDSAYLFCLLRAIAAFGAAAAIVVPRAMVRDLADGKNAGAMMSDILQIMSVAPVLAPVLGSLVLDVAGWRLIFVVAGIYGLAGLILSRRLPETLDPQHRSAIKPFAIFASYMAILREPEFFTNAMIGVFGMAALFAYLSGAPTVFMQQFHLSAQRFGVLLSLLGIAMIGFFRINRYIVQRFGPDRAISLGIALWLIAGIGLIVTVDITALGVTAIFIALALFNCAYSFIPSNSQVNALSRHQDHAATATALMSTLQYCAGGLAGILTGKLADGTGKPMAWSILACAVIAAIMAMRRPARAARRKILLD